MCSKCNNKCNCDCKPKCEPCAKQSKINYCGNDISCVGIKKNDDLHESIFKIGSKLCQVIQSNNYAFGINKLTYAQAQQKKNNKKIEEGTVYLITDRGIYLTGASDSNYSVNGIRVQNILKSVLYLDDGLNHKGVFSPFLHRNVSLGETYVWGTKVWEVILASNNASYTDQLSLDLNIFREITDSTHVEEKSFDILYDFDRDIVTKQIDVYNNEVNYTDINGEASTTYTDWGMLGGDSVNNICESILNNHVEQGYEISNNISRRIENNVSNYIYSNFCKDIISNFKCNIYGNNLGKFFNIRENESSGINDILIINNNRNSGDIELNVAGAIGLSIPYNINNGNISAGVFNVNITDPIVNK